MTENQRLAKDAGLRKRKNSEQSRAEIFDAAIKEFASRGPDGARVDAIAKRTRTTRAMVYYYFKSKEGLYRAVLENAYRGMREAERELDLAHSPPIEAMRRLVAFTYGYYHDHPEFVALVMAENQSGGRHIRKVHRMHRLNVSIIDIIAGVLDRGASAGLFRTGIDPVDVHMMISSLGWFPIANRHTFGYVFGRDLGSRRNIEHNRELITQMILRFIGVDSHVPCLPPRGAFGCGAAPTQASLRRTELSADRRAGSNLAQGAGTGRGDGPSYAGK